MMHVSFACISCNPVGIVLYILKVPCMMLHLLVGVQERKMKWLRPRAKVAKAARVVPKGHELAKLAKAVVAHRFPQARWRGWWQTMPPG